MKRKTRTSEDSENRRILAALKRAAKRAWELSVATGTPFYIWQDGKVVNLNPQGRLRKKPSRFLITHLDPNIPVFKTPARPGTRPMPGAKRTKARPKKRGK